LLNESTVQCGPRSRAHVSERQRGSNYGRWNKRRGRRRDYGPRFRCACDLRRNVGHCATTRTKTQYAYDRKCHEGGSQHDDDAVNGALRCS
jgi:hypothetical protein